MKLLVTFISLCLPAFVRPKVLQKYHCDSKLYDDMNQALTTSALEIPYQLEVFKTKLNPGESVDLTLSKINESAPDFVKFFVKAVDSSDDSIYGQFHLIGNDTRIVECGFKDTNAIFYDSSTPKSSIRMKWISPSIVKEKALKIKFLFTVYQSLDVLWADQLGKRSIEVSNFADPIGSAIHIDYLGCGSSKACFGISSNCIDNGDCQAMLTYYYNSNKNVFDLNIHGKDLETDEYVAIGLSFDNKMGDDIVFYCIDGLSKVNIAWNSGKSNHKGVQNLDIVNRGVKSEDGFLTCEFEIPEILNPIPPNENQPRKFDLFNEKFFLLMAVGMSNGKGDLQYHQVRIASTESLDMKLITVTAEDYSIGWHVQLHGSLMVFAWLAFAASGMYMARFHKQTFKSIRPMGLDFWFRFHQLSMLLATILTIISLFVVFAVAKLEPFNPAAIKQNPHAVVGSVCILCCVLQPFMAIFRCHPGAKNRWIFNWIHRFVGNCALVLAIATTFLAIELPLPNLPGDLTKALIAYVVVHIIAYGIPTIQHLFQSRSSVSAENKYSNEQELENGSWVRKLVGLIYFLFVWSFSIAFAVIIFNSRPEKK